MTSLSVRVDEPELVSYAYSYPHKSSYRLLEPPVPIHTAWESEQTDGLSLYLHIPFCEMRCGFCNLFTQSQPADDVVEAYLASLLRQQHVVRDAVPQARFQQAAIGGGTPTLLSAQQLDLLLTQLEDIWGVRFSQLPTSIETSPATATLDRLRCLRDFGVQRISLGVQAFDEMETRRLGRPQSFTAVTTALERIRTCGFPVLNLDLIYGAPAQTQEAWLHSVEVALDYRPEELYLYPLYVRPETGLARTGPSGVSHRSDLYRAARDRLASAGYEQSSLRGFRRPEITTPSTYTCQRDGMIGLGCGARSYTRSLHYGTRFATTQAGIRAILRDWISLDDGDFAQATHGYRLNEEDQWRRYFLMSLLQCPGLLVNDFRDRFPLIEIDELPEWRQLLARGWGLRTENRWQLTEAGIEHSDHIGPLVYSRKVRERLRAFLSRTSEETS